MTQIFSWFDMNNDGFICLEDLNQLSLQYAGQNYFIMKDILSLIHTLNEKIRKRQQEQAAFDPSFEELKTNVQQT